MSVLQEMTTACLRLGASIFLAALCVSASVDILGMVYAVAYEGKIWLDSCHSLNLKTARQEAQCAKSQQEQRRTTDIRRVCHNNIIIVHSIIHLQHS